MSKESASSLLHQEIDGELDHAARVELATLLAADPGLFAERDELQRLDRMLRVVADAESPPSDLARRIAARIELPTSPGPLDRILAWWQSPALVPAAAFAMGLVVAVLLYPTLQGTLDGVDATRMTGTMISEPTRAGLMPHARLGLALDALQGQVTLADSGDDAALLEFDLASSGPVDIVIDLGGSGFEFSPVDAGGAELLARDGRLIRLRSTGERYFTLPLHGHGAEAGSVKVEFSMAGRTLSAGVLAAR